LTFIPTCQPDLHAIASILVNHIQTLDFFTQAQRHAVLPQVVHQRIDDLAVHEWQQPGAFIDQCDAHA
jgi:hypothetical protein